MSWNGTVDVSLPADRAPDALPRIALRGTAAASGFSFAQRVSKVSLSAARARFDMSKPGIVVEPDRQKTGATRIHGDVNANLTDARFDQPETGLSVSPGEMTINSRLSLSLPPSTAAFTAKLSGKIAAKALTGSLAPAGIDRIEADGFQLSYENAALDISADGRFAGTAAGAIELTGMGVTAAEAFGSAAADGLKGEAGQITFGQSDNGQLAFSLEGTLDGKKSVSDPDGQ